jgi:antirestriction protein ArdC
MSDKIHQLVTEKVIKALEAGVVPWRKPWKYQSQTGGWPLRMSNGNRYRGINVFLLAVTAHMEGYTSPWWGSYDEIAERSGMVKTTVGKRTVWGSPDGKPRGVRKGEKSTLIIWWSQIRVEDKDKPGETKTVPVLRHFIVFNACQADALPAKFYPAPVAETRPETEVIASAQAIIDGYLAAGGPQFRHVHGNRACYQAGPDLITMPERSQFASAGEYYSTGLHECGHSTGHKNRLNRAGIAEFDHFGSQQYSKEELVAEMTAAMLMAQAGLDLPDVFANSANYIGSWLKELKNDKKLVVSAAAKAQAAMDMILAPTMIVDAGGQADAAVEMAA